MTSQHSGVAASFTAISSPTSLVADSSAASDNGDSDMGETYTSPLSPSQFKKKKRTSKRSRLSEKANYYMLAANSFIIYVQCEVEKISYTVFCTNYFTALQRHCRLLRTAACANEVERPRLIPRRFKDSIPTEAARIRPPKEIAVVEFQRWLKDKPPGYIVFSDGSKIETDTAGYGFAVFHNGRLVDWGSGQLGRREVFDAEIHGAVQGLRCAVLANFANEPITVCMDNTSVIDYLLAKQGASLPVLEHLPSVSYRRRQIKGQIAVDYRQWWQGVERTGYTSLGLAAELQKLPELTLPRRLLGYLLAARSHHGDFADYHERFHPGQATLECPCGRQKSPTHLFYCRKVPRHLRARLTPDPEAAIGRFLGRSYKVYLRIADFYYTKINKRY
ncbi:reverse transcriptase [Pochonia chlamydosporia 170]|uniref:Reverse transcriptase n=1 Tax=Pochonia chlamydosporia 170 TaxID=1380566 RepID=A0A179EW29_METCM|nr:reverse transcriptase [Pochonia chlamydosporia 170]OAQ57404.1 reverse transcriptase [Pochonia chlamydosporia 170]